MKEEQTTRLWAVAVRMLLVIAVMASFVLASTAQAAQHDTEGRRVIPMGRTVGIKLFSDGVMVVGFSEGSAAGGSSAPARECGLREGDIITQLDDTMVFVEVKSRLDRYGDPMESITPRKIRFLTRAADSYLRNQPYDFSYRFDVITVVHGPDFPEPEISHYEDAFLPPLSSR